jgi:hypothetical protein
MSAACGLAELEKTPLWYPMMTQMDEDKHLAEIEDGEE